MKKLVLFAVAAMALSFASCGNKAAAEAEAQRIADSIAAVEAEAAAKAETLVDSTVAVVDSAAAEVAQ